MSQTSPVAEADAEEASREPDQAHAEDEDFRREVGLPLAGNRRVAQRQRRAARRVIVFIPVLIKGPDLVRGPSSIKGVGGRIACPFVNTNPQIFCLRLY